MPFTDQQRALLRQPLDLRLASQRTQSNQTFTYLEGHEVINQANAVFGHDGWSYSVDRLDMTAMPDGRGVVYTAVVTVTTEAGALRQDVGCQTIRNTLKDGKERDNVNDPDQHDNARKTAVTDALKRALRTFGDQFGNGLYDKDADTQRLFEEARRGDGTYELRLAVQSLLADDDEARAKLPKPVNQMDRAFLEKLHARLVERATGPRTAAGAPAATAASTKEEVDDPPFEQAAGVVSAVTDGAPSAAASDPALADTLRKVLEAEGRAMAQGGNATAQALIKARKAWHRIACHDATQADIDVFVQLERCMRPPTGAGDVAARWNDASQARQDGLITDRQYRALLGYAQRRLNVNDPAHVLARLPATAYGYQAERDTRAVAR